MPQAAEGGRICTLLSWTGRVASTAAISESLFQQDVP